MRTIHATLALAAVLAAGLTGSAYAQVMSTADQTLMSFSGEAGEPRWVAVNDGVMGGLSQGGPRIADGQLIFTGTLSLQNNGGFSSIRTTGRAFDLRDRQAMILRVKGDGRTYQLRLATDATVGGSSVSYGADFPTTAGQWTETRIAFDTLVPTFRGEPLSGPPLDLAKVEEIGILIGDKREGAFSLAVDWIKVR